MPVFLPELPGTFVAGNAGDGGVVSTNGGRIVIGPNAGNVHPFTAREAVCQYYTVDVPDPRLVAVDVFTGQWRNLFLADGVGQIRWSAVYPRGNC